MPVIVAREDFGEWLNGDPDTAAQLLQPFPADRMAASNPIVNNFHEIHLSRPFVGVHLAHWPDEDILAVDVDRLAGNHFGFEKAGTRIPSSGSTENRVSVRCPGCSDTFSNVTRCR